MNELTNKHSFIYVLVTCVLTVELLNIHYFLLLSSVLLRTIQCSSGSSMRVYHFFWEQMKYLLPKKEKGNVESLKLCVDLPEAAIKKECSIINEAGN